MSADGARVVVTTSDSVIWTWRADTGAELATYSAPVEGSHRLTLSSKGTKIASASPNGMIRVWNAELPPSDADVSFTVDEARCIVFRSVQMKSACSYASKMKLRFGTSK